MSPEDQVQPEEQQQEQPQQEEPAGKEVNELKAQLELEKQTREKLAEEVKITKDFAARLIDRMKTIAAQEEQEPARETPDDFLEAFRQDPRGALDRHLNERMAPIFEEQLRGQEEIAVETARKAVGDKAWDRYSREIADFMAPISTVLRAKPQAWVNAFKQIRANHFDEEVERRIQEKVEAEKFSALESASPPNSGKRAKAPVSAIEKQIAEGLLGRFDEEEWRKWRGDTLGKGE